MTVGPRPSSNNSVETRNSMGYCVVCLVGINLHQLIMVVSSNKKKNRDEERIDEKYKALSEDQEELEHWVCPVRHIMTKTRRLMLT